tara:strand:+ start:277 stop:723 length:447 start_codon:yes stop_codon:yes gene_type:complete
MPLITFSDKVDSKVSTVPIINKIVANDINQLKDGVNANETAISAINGTTYTSLVQLLTQSATNAPVATEVYNNTGETYTWSYVSSGVYRVTATGNPFTINKTVVFLNNGSTVTNGLEPRWNRISNTIIDIFTPNESMTKGSFEIKIYS